MATVKRSDLRSALRLMIQDSGTQNDVSDEAANLAINQAIVAHTTEVPFAAEYEYTTATGVHEFTLPDYFVYAAYVRGYFISTNRLQFIEEIEEADWLSYWKDTQEPVGFRVNFPSQDKLYLPRAPLSEPITFYYGVSRPELAEDTDAVDLASRAWSKEAILLYAAYRAFEYLSSARARLEQWATKIDQRVDNPLEQEAKRWLAEYTRLVNKHTQAGSYGFS